MIKPDYRAKSYLIGGWQWYRNSPTLWAAEFGWYVFKTDGGWWLMGNGVEHYLTSGGVKHALWLATQAKIMH